MESTELHRERIYLEDVMIDRDDAKELRAFGANSAFRRWHAELWDVWLERLTALVRRRLGMTAVGSLVTTAVLVATLAFALVLAGRGSISLGDAAIAVVGLQQLSSRLQAAGTAFGGVHEGVTFLSDFEDFRAELPAIRGRRPMGTPPQQPSVLTVEHVSYRYPGADKDALVDVSFSVQRGQILAIVGANGSGKSTLAKLLCGLLPPSAGRILWDGVDLSTCAPDIVRAQIAPVFQDYARFQLTVGQAIGLGDVGRLDDVNGMRRAAERAGLNGVLAASPRALDTRLGKAFRDGIDLSGGEWQRLAIARALFRDASFFVLDEPSASLDPRAEEELFSTLEALCSDRFIIFISHRLATVRSADVVLVLDEGEVVEVGSHDDLLNAGALYADLYNLQAERYGARPPSDRLP
jgi:ATP-binding cassette subfamily B protein